MMSGLILLTVIVFIAVISYRRPRLEQRVFRKIPIIDWINILLLPIIAYFGLVMIVRNILERPQSDVFHLDDFHLLTIGILFLIYLFVGSSIHFVAKVLWRFMPKHNKSIVYQINEIFHGKLSHYFFYVCALMIIFIIALLEINHPYQIPLNRPLMWLLSFLGIVSGFSTTKAILNASGWFGGYNKPLFFLSTALATILITLFKYFHLKLVFYPMNLFIMTLFLAVPSTFLIRQFMIVTKLSRKAKFRVVMRVLSG